MHSPPKENKRILFVEDNEEDGALVKMCLRNYDIIYAHDYDEGLRLAHRRYFDLYILDNWLPDGSGIGLCRAIREFDPYTPILFYSGAAYTRDVDAALRSGAQGYLVKPVNIDELKEVVARLTSPMSSRDTAAWKAEIVAIREEIASQRKENYKLFDRAKEKRLRAEEKMMRLKAEKAYLEAGGIRGEFARRWPSVFVEEVRSYRAIGAYERCIEQVL